MESAAHRWLKDRATRWFAARQWRALGQEVTLPTGRYRADVAAWTDVHSVARTLIAEAKVTRADFLRDAEDQRDLWERRARLQTAARVAHVRLRGSMPEQPGQGTLFVRGTPGDTVPARDARVLRLQWAAVQRRLAQPAKFSQLAWWRAADELWIVTRRGLVRPGEVPADWGLVEFDRHGDARIRVDAPDLEASDQWRNRVLRNIAVAGSRALVKGPVPSAHPLA